MKGFVIAALAAATLCGLVSCGSDPGNEIQIAKDIPFEMVLIHGGSFTMGSTEEGAAGCIAPSPARTVTVDGFYMGKYQITQGHYYSVMEYNPSYFYGAYIPAGVNVNNLPVERVSWYNAVEFCNKLSVLDGYSPVYDIDKENKDPANTEEADTLKWTVTMIPCANGYRLPTEAEWEYACRAGTNTAYNTGDIISDETGWYNENSSGRTHEVGEKPPNSLGLYDMHGNVWEWCWDYVTYGGDNYYVNPATDTNPLGLGSGNRRAERGGSWKSPAYRVTSSYRERYQPQNSGNDLGFRVIRTFNDEE